jgi:hypothetical protein
MGALGVAMGTLLGAAAGVAMHFGISMRYTQSSLTLSRIELLLKGMLRPALIAIPSALLVRRWWQPGPPSIDAPLYVAWSVVTLLLAWFIGMSREDRALAFRLVSRGGLARGD